MFGFSSFKIIGSLIVLTTISLAIYGGYTYVTNLQKDNVRLEKDNAALEISNKQYELQIKTVKNNLAEVNKSYDKLNKDFDESKERIKYMSNLFSDHDFENLVKKKSGLITIRMQKATKKLFDEFERVTSDE